MRCAVFGCLSGTHSRKNPCTGVKLFPFPKDETLCKKWRIATGQAKQLKSTDNAHICSKHFADNDFRDHLKYQLLGYRTNKYLRLNEGAVPSVGLPQAAEKRLAESAATIRLKKRQQKQLVNELLNGSSNPDYMFIQPPAPAPEPEPKSADFGVQTDLTKIENELLTNAIVKQQEIITKQGRDILKMQATLKAVGRLFSANQLAKLRNNSRIVWKPMEITDAAKIYFTSPKAYHLLLDKGFPYPAVSTLKSWSRKTTSPDGNEQNVNEHDYCLQNGPKKSKTKKSPLPTTSESPDAIRTDLSSTTEQ